MANFELISKYEGKDSKVNLLPKRKTKESAGYDFYVAEDTIIPPYEDHMNKMCDEVFTRTGGYVGPYTLDELAAITKKLNTKPTLVPTGVKAKLDPGTYLGLTVRSSCPLKYWLVLANSEGIVDADYYNSPDTEGHIYFQLINFSPVPILLKKGDVIGQGIIHKYEITEDDAASGVRTGGFGSTDA